MTSKRKSVEATLMGCLKTTILTDDQQKLLCRRLTFEVHTHLGMIQTKKDEVTLRSLQCNL